MELLRDIFVNTISNLLWVALVFIVLYIRDRKKKEQIDRCLGAYLIYLLKSTAAVRNTIYPYVHLIHGKVIQGTILPTLLKSVYDLSTNILKQTQEGMLLIESRHVQEKILQLYRKVITFQSHVSESQVQVDIIVGNPMDLIESPRQEQEIEIYVNFAREFQAMIREIYQIFPANIRANITDDILQTLDEKTPLQEQYEK